MPDTDRVAATLAGIRDRWAARRQYSLGFDPVDASRLLAAVEAALELAGPEPCDPDPYPEHPMIRLVRCDELREAIGAALTGTQLSEDEGHG